VDQVRFAQADPEEIEGLLPGSSLGGGVNTHPRRGWANHTRPKLIGSGALVCLDEVVTPSVE
jgi:hypothetical protein